MIIKCFQSYDFFVVFVKCPYTYQQRYLIKMKGRELWPENPRGAAEVQV